jgi:hypothetical protein
MYNVNFKVGCAGRVGGLILIAGKIWTVSAIEK